MSERVCRRLPAKPVLNNVFFVLVFLVSGVKDHPVLFHDVSREQSTRQLSLFTSDPKRVNIQTSTSENGDSRPDPGRAWSRHWPAVCIF